MTTLAKTESGRKLSNPAKLLAAFMEASNVWDSRELSSLTGVPLRTIQRLKLECATHGVTYVGGSSATHGAVGVTECAKDATHGVSGSATSATHGTSSDDGIARAYKESLRDKNLPKRLDSPLYPPDPYAQASIDENGRLVLTDKFRNDWIERFGGDVVRFELALVQAQGYVQPNNRTKTLDVQLSAQLARIASEKLDRDSRYAKASEQKAAAPRQPTAKEAKLERGRALYAKLFQKADEAAACAN